MTSGEIHHFDKAFERGQGQTPLDRFEARERAYKQGPRRYTRIGHQPKPVKKGPRKKGIYEYPKKPRPQKPRPKPPVPVPMPKQIQPRPAPKPQPKPLPSLPKLPWKHFRKGNIVLDVVFGILQTHFEEMIRQVELQPHNPGGVDLTGTNWNKVGSCGPWREDSILPGGNFCFVGNGVPESSLHQPLPSGVSLAYTVQINGGDVPGGIDCTASQFYESQTPFNPDPVPVFRPPVTGPLLPVETQTPATQFARLNPFPDPPPIRGPEAKGGHPGGNGPPPGRTRYPGPPRIGETAPPQPGRRPPGVEPPPHRWRPPPPGTKEKKTQIKMGKFWRGLKKALEEVSEVNDLLDSFYDALPWEIRRQYMYKKGGLHAQDKLRILYRHYLEIQLYGHGGLLWNILDNHVKDWGIGKIGSALKHATRKNPYWISPVGPQAGGRFRGERVYVQPI